MYKAFGDLVVLDDVSFFVNPGETLCILGRSGVGKSVALQHIMGFLKPDSGRIMVAGEDITGFDEKQLQAIRRKVTMVFQNGALFDSLTVGENVAFPLREHTDLSEPLIRTLVLMTLQAVGLRAAADQAPGELSGGMARRVALARAIVMDPEFIFYDEPFTGLDPISLGAIVCLIRRLNEALGITSIVVSHDVGVIGHVADFSYLIANGKVVARGTPEALKEDRSSWVHQFMNGLVEGPVPFHLPAPDYAGSLLEEEP
ncbi:MAG TPA: ABC transporter ATP-binding protein [Gammaproteobacteria bacterium]|nr:ABC transporter ATP-binding protein [Gammaproteobacteria bacterium]